MDEEDLQPKRQKPAPKILDSLSIEELEQYIADLETEIRRVKAAIGAKQSHRSGADQFFKK